MTRHNLGAHRFVHSVPKTHTTMAGSMCGYDGELINITFALCMLLNLSFLLHVLDNYHDHFADEYKGRLVFYIGGGIDIAIGAIMSAAMASTYPVYCQSMYGSVIMMFGAGMICAGYALPAPIANSGGEASCVEHVDGVEPGACAADGGLVQRLQRARFVGNEEYLAL